MLRSPFFWWLSKSALAPWFFAFITSTPFCCQYASWLGHFEALEWAFCLPLLVLEDVHCLLWWAQVFAVLTFHSPGGVARFLVVAIGDVSCPDYDLEQDQRRTIFQAWVGRHALLPPLHLTWFTLSQQVVTRPIVAKSHQIGAENLLCSLLKTLPSTFFSLASHCQRACFATPLFRPVACSRYLACQAEFSLSLQWSMLL